MLPFKSFITEAVLKFFAGTREVDSRHVASTDLVDFRKRFPDAGLPPFDSMMWRRWYRARFPQTTEAKIDAAISLLKSGNQSNYRFPVYYYREGDAPAFIDRIILFTKRAVPHKCDARCRNAKRGDCECSCGGEFHGCNAT
jgi:hypothetical protein